MKKWKIWSGLIVLLFIFQINCLLVKAETIYSSPYVSFSPDGQAWTTDAGNKNVVWYAADGTDDVETGVKRMLLDLQTGEHYYSYKRTGSVPVAKWMVHTPKVNCCHNAYPSDGEFHGVDFVMQTCYKPHFSGWRPVCADCGRVIAQWNFYMSKQAASSLSYLEFGENIYYYYLCPFNRNLEMGMSMHHHTCMEISANRYRVVYDSNTGDELYSGYMAPSFHMYNNATTYEGRTVTPQTHLNLNSYGRIGWEFAGWNTACDGSGTWFEDGAEIWNLCEEDYNQDDEIGTVVLYAMWTPSESILEVDPNGGYYCGEEGITEIEGGYGSVYIVDRRDIWAPDDVEVCFDTCGGDELDPIYLSVYFSEWKQSVPFYGELQGKEYRYSGPDGSKDRITALYEVDDCELPEPYRENYSFAGWYYDPEYKKKAGDVDSEFSSGEDVTLYAQWAELVLTTEENEFTSYSGGALNLFWNQDDGRIKSYKIYQCRAGEEWHDIYELEDDVETREFCREFVYCRNEETFTVPYTGFYYIEAYGAQGGTYGDYTGGLGGMVKGKFWLEQGQEVTVCVGGQSGFNGGGGSSVFQHGGGYTSVSTEDTLLLIAGGGGGAGDAGNGGAGGMETSLVEEGHEGEYGGAGGGGGYLGGRSGETVVHYHEEGVCNHIHEGSPSKNGGCYTQPIKCGKRLTHTHTRTEYWSWGGSDESYCPNCGADASKGEECIGHETKHYRHDCSVHGTQASNTNSSKPSVCPAIAEYGLTCERSEEYICGYPYDGYIISALPSYGGSSYANDELSPAYTKIPGVRQGNGYVVIRGEDLKFSTDTTLEDVPAFDMAAPRPVDVETVRLVPEDERSVSVWWDSVQDLGTVYYHKAESYLAGRGTMLSVSNITADNMVSGLIGYIYQVDGHTDTLLDGREGKFLSATEATAKLVVDLTEEYRYMHVVSIDGAGNISETVHFPIGSLEGHNEGVKWPVLTEPLRLVESESSYHSAEEDLYYVRCDGTAPFVLEYNAIMQGAATLNYQLNYAMVESAGLNGNRVNNIVYIPSSGVSDEVKEYVAADLRFRTDGEGYLQNGSSVYANRSNRCRRINVRQEYILAKAAHGQRMELVPRAGVDDAGKIVYSEYDKDKANGIWIVGDGEAPVITGMEILENLDVLDRRTQNVLLHVTAKDEHSGIKEFYIEIENLDNGAKGIYIPNEYGVIEVDICADVAIFSGDFVVTAFATDNVGNVNRLCYGTTEFDLRAEIKSFFDPHEPLFKKGESGCLNITSWGYAERIEVEFPEAFTVCNPLLNHVYEYELKGAYKQEEQLVFMIPLEVPDGMDYTVTVRAYKADKMIEQHPALAVLGVNGSILDDLRTRLR
ncbi:MAG: hypothetical protein E7292_07580 [Lachnospiraceae bacterium]|nr:hypothetical protein [Lachnospiraceae bacterium]